MLPLASCGRSTRLSTLPSSSASSISVIRLHSQIEHNQSRIEALWSHTVSPYTVVEC